MAFETGLKIKEFYDLLPRQFNNCVAGYTKRQTEQVRNSWEQTRQMMFAVLSPNLKNKSTTPMDVIKFPWDPKEEEIDLKAEIEAVKENQEYWNRIDGQEKKAEKFNF